MSIVVFYLCADGSPAKCEYEDKDFSQAMKQMKNLRNQGMTHVIMSNEPASMVGKPGVDSVVDGKTPDGKDYDWTKQDRAGRMRKSDEFKPVRNDGEEVR